MVSQKGNICCVLKIVNIVVLYPTTLNLTRNTCLLIIVVLGQLARALTVRSDTLLPPTSIPGHSARALTVHSDTLLPPTSIPGNSAH